MRISQLNAIDSSNSISATLSAGHPLSHGARRAARPRGSSRPPCRLEPQEAAGGVHPIVLLVAPYIIS